MYPTYQPYQPYQQRQQEYIPSQIPGLVQTPQAFGIRPVASRAEAEVAQIPFDGTPAYFENKACREIYTRAFRPDGTAPLTVYKMVEENGPRYVTVEQFEQVMQEIERLKERRYEE